MQKCLVGCVPEKRRYKCLQKATLFRIVGITNEEHKRPGGFHMIYHDCNN